jgi:hypothetical protein
MQQANRAEEGVVNEFTLPMALFLSTGAIALFSFIAVATWSDNRRREREAYYKSEALKKIAETQGDNAVAVAVLREEERNTLRRRREGIKLGGLVTTAVGIGMMVFLRAIVPDRPVYLVGLIPLLIGVVLLAYSYILAPKD